MIKASICICTFQRPALLRLLLSSINKQEDIDCDMEVIIVDNDPSQSAKSVINEFFDLLRYPLKFIYLGEPNISLARNAAIQAASGNFLIFIDDDEVPEINWIHNLMQTQRKTDADIVLAPVLPSYSPGVPEWVIKGGYFDRNRFLTGTCVDYRDARSGNVLIRRSILDCEIRVLNGKSGPFDPSFGRSGGEDSMLFRRLHLNGASMVWCDEASVSEHIPIERACARWLLKRSYRTGQIFLRTELAVLVGWRRYWQAMYLGFRASVQILLSLIISLFYLPLNRLVSFRWLRTCYSQIGKLSFFWGSRTKGYGNN